ncbi:MAG: hypothetical protein IKD69_00195 [Solobacterium sp.]|nr:hypothetical protein [Solobacterium sp.]
MFWNRKKVEHKEYDREKLEPVLRRSICTGETVAGFRNRKNDEFREVMLIMEQKDLDTFKETYGITEELRVIY